MTPRVRRFRIHVARACAVAGGYKGDIRCRRAMPSGRQASISVRAPSPSRPTSTSTSAHPSGRSAPSSARPSPSLSAAAASARRSIAWPRTWSQPTTPHRAGPEPPGRAADETGWKVGAQLQWLWAFVTPEVTVYRIMDGRGYDEACVLPPDFSAPPAVLSSLPRPHVFANEGQSRVRGTARSASRHKLRRKDGRNTAKNVPQRGTSRTSAARLTTRIPPSRHQWTRGTPR